MGNECIPEEREVRYSAFHQAIFAIEKDIKKEMKNQDISKKKYMPFALINQDICKKYEFLLNEQFDKNIARNTIFDYKDLVKKLDDRDYTYIYDKFSFNFPINFIFITEDFLKIITDSIEVLDKKNKNKLAIIFKTIIGGGCLIMKDAKDKDDNNPFRYIILYREIEENKGNEIDFFLFINDKNERIMADKYILKHNLLNYFKSIDYNYKEDFKLFYYKDKKKMLGYIVRCSDVSVIGPYLDKLEPKEHSLQTNNFQNLKQNNFQNPQQKIQNNFINANQNNFQNIPQNNSLQNNFQNIQQNNFPNAHQNNLKKNQQNTMNQFNLLNNNDAFKKDAKSGTTITRNTYAKIYPEKFLTSAISFFFEVDKLTKFFSQNETLDFPSFSKKLIEMLGQDIKNQTKYEQIFSEILTKLEPQNLINKEYYNQTMQYDETKGLDSFMESHKNANIIKKLFFIPKEEKIFCEKCKMNSFQFNYSKYISLNTSNSDEFSLKLFQRDIKFKEEKSCNFCNGVKTKIKMEEIYLDFPEWLIVVIEPSIIKKININNFLVLMNKNKNQEYQLSMFINEATNILYLIRKKNIKHYQCHQFNQNRMQNPEELDNKFPCVLFYHLKNISQNNNLQNLNNPNIQNQVNQNNFPNMNFMNGFQANLQQNQQNINAFKMNNEQIKQPIIQNQQNNAINMNQINMNQQNNAINMNQINTNQQNNAMNMNQINMNQQNNAMNMNQINTNQQNNAMNMNQMNINQQIMIQQNNVQNMNQQFNVQNFNQQNMNLQQNLNPQLQNFNGNFTNFNCGNFNQNMNNNNFQNVGNGVNQMNNMNNMPINNMNNMNNMNKVGMNNNGNQMNMNINMNNMNAKTFNINMNISNPNIMNNNINLNMMENNLNNNMMGNNMGNSMPMNNNMLINNISSNNINNFGNNNFGMNNMNMMNMNMMNNMNNMNMNNMNMMNNMNNMNMVNKMNNQNQNLNQLDEVPEESGDTIFITFTFIKNKRQIYLDVARSIKFREAINMLTNKYEWLKSIKKIKYSFNKSVIDEKKFDKTLSELGIDESSDIHILSD